MKYITFVDVETTGLEVGVHEIIEVAAARLRLSDLEFVAGYEARVRPTHIETADAVALELNGYSAEGWARAISLGRAVRDLSEMLGWSMMAGHNVAFDRGFLWRAYDDCHVPRPQVSYRLVDTCAMAMPLLFTGEVGKLSLEALCEHFGISNAAAHTAAGDVQRTVQLFRALLRRWKGASA